MYNIYTSRTYLYKENKQLKETIKEMCRERTDLINNLYEQGKAYNYVAKKYEEIRDNYHNNLDMVIYNYEERIKHMSDRIDNLLTMCADLKAQLKIKEKTNGV
jgi:predicted nuclease with TOPRIM domain